MEKNQKLFTTKETAEILRISPITLWRERKAGRIGFRRAASKIVFTQDDIENYLETNKRATFAAQN